MGGEELAAFLPETPLVEGYVVAERIRTRIEALTFEDCFPGLRITASLGVAQCRLGESQDAWIQRADEALYAAKRGGRNRTVVDDGYGGLAFGDEGERCADLLGDKRVMIMGNHGLMIVGPTVAKAFDDLYDLVKYRGFCL